MDMHHVFMICLCSIRRIPDGVGLLAPTRYPNCDFHLSHQHGLLSFLLLSISLVSLMLLSLLSSMVILFSIWRTISLSLILFPTSICVVLVFLGTPPAPHLLLLLSLLRLAGPPQCTLTPTAHSSPLLAPPTPHSSPREGTQLAW